MTERGDSYGNTNHSSTDTTPTLLILARTSENGAIQLVWPKVSYRWRFKDTSPEGKCSKFACHLRRRAVNRLKLDQSTQAHAPPTGSIAYTGNLALQEKFAGLVTKSRTDHLTSSRSIQH